MNIATEQLEPNVLTITISLEKDDYKKEYSRKITEASRRMNLKGFRPGQVPRKLVERMVGAQLKMEVVQQALDDALGQYLKDSKILTFTRLMQNADQPEMDVAKEDDFIFKLDVGVVPDFTLGPDQTIDVLVPALTDEDLEKQIENNRELFSQEIEGEEMSEEVSRVIFELEALDADGNSFAEPLKAQGGAFLKADLEREEVAEFLKGKKPGDTIEIDDIVALFPEESRRTHFTSVPEERAAERTGLYLMTITGFKVNQLAELTPAFFERFLDKPLDEEGNPTDFPTEIEELKALFRKQLVERYTYHGQTAAAWRLAERCAEEFDMEISNAFIDRLIADSEDKPEEGQEIDYDVIRNNLKLRSLENSLIRTFSESEEREEDLDRYREFLLAMYLRSRLESMGVPGYFFQSNQQVIQFGQQMLQDEEFREKLQESLFRGIMLRRALNHVKHNEVEISGDFLAKLNEYYYPEESESEIEEAVIETDEKSEKESSSKAKETEADETPSEVEEKPKRKRTTKARKSVTTEKAEESSSDEVKEEKPKKRATRTRKKKEEGEEK